MTVIKKRIYSLLIINYIEFLFIIFRKGLIPWRSSQKRKVGVGVSASVGKRGCMAGPPK
jgi:hypothetical protein